MNNYTRLYTLDYLRGIAAFGIMFYHCCSWAYGNFGADSFMGKFGVYGVAIFYILSGLTLYYVYYERMEPSVDGMKDFFLKRFFRIFPLLWLTIFLTIVMNRLRPSYLDMGLNLTGLFGIFKWDGYIGTGVWSIGNELVFYLFFPLFVFFARSEKKLFYLLTALLAGGFLYFAFFKFEVALPLSDKEQWSVYTNPLNQVFLFLGGFLMAYFFENMQLRKWQAPLLFVIALSIFTLYTPYGQNLSAGINRLVLSATSFLICLAFYKNTLQFPPLADKMLRLLGEASYSVYLLHPIVWIIVVTANRKLGLGLGPALQIAATIIITVLAGYANYIYFETYFIRLGKRAVAIGTWRNTNGNFSMDRSKA